MVPGLLGKDPSKNKRTTYSFTLEWTRWWTEYWPEPAPGLAGAKFVLYHFLMELLYLIFCDSSGYCNHANWLIYLSDLDQLDHNDWGGASYA